MILQQQKIINHLKTRDLIVLNHEITFPNSLINLYSRELFSNIRQTEKLLKIINYLTMFIANIQFSCIFSNPYANSIISSTLNLEGEAKEKTT